MREGYSSQFVYLSRERLMCCFLMVYGGDEHYHVNSNRKLFLGERSEPHTGVFNRDFA